MPSSSELKALARTYASRIAAGEVTPAAGARLIWTDVFYHLEMGDHSVDQFIYWADAIEDAEDEQRREFCENAIKRIAEQYLRDHPGTVGTPGTPGT